MSRKLANIALVFVRKENQKTSSSTSLNTTQGLYGKFKLQTR
jgi:hypothetical protein